MPGFAVGLLLALAGVPAASAQPPQVLLDGLYGTRAMWRGTPRVTSPVSQLSGTIALPLPGGHVSASVWSLIELHAPDPGDYSIGGAERRVAEFDYTVQYALRTRCLDLMTGLTRYQLNNDSALGSLYREFGTTELFAGISFREGVLRRAGFTPSITTWLDVNKVRGAYTEFDLTWAMPLIPFEKPLGVVHLSVRTGLNLGQSTANGATGYFEEDGFTHIETLGTFTARLAPGLSLGFTWHRSFGLDPATQRGDPRSSATDRGSWGWIEAWLTARRPGAS